MLHHTARWLVCACVFISVAIAAEPDFYELLGVERSASTREIRKAFKSIALVKHPDKNPDDPQAHDKFLRINRAYEVLKDDDLRKKYDMHGEDGLKEDGPSGRNYRSWSFYKQEFGIYDNDDAIITLSRSDFEMSVRNTEDIWFINFYSPQCSHCHELAPTWREVAQELEGVVRIGAVNCADDRGLCQQEGIRGYPSLVIYPAREKYTADRIRKNILKFALRHANTDVQNLWHMNFEQRTSDPKVKDKPWLVTYCGDGGDCLDETTLMKVSAVLEDLVVVASISCHGNEGLCEKQGVEHGTFYYSQGVISGRQNAEEITSLHAQDVAQAVLRHLPDLPEMDEEKFQDERKRLEAGHGLPALVCFYNTDHNGLELRKLPALLANIKVFRVDCRSAKTTCDELYVKKFPSFALFKSYGGHEIHHGRHLAHDIANFAKDVSMTTMSTLSPEDFPHIVDSGQPWMVDFFSPTCPPCLRLLPELRKASRHMGDIKFGTIDCSLHHKLCSDYSIRSYPTAIFYNNTSPHHFMGQHYAREIIDFIHDTMNPPVILLDLETFQNNVKTKPDNEIWLIDYYAPWCGPCRQLLPEWTKLAKIFKDSDMFKIASVDCTQHSQLCELNGVNSYPSVRLYAQGPLHTNKYHVYNGFFRDAHNLKQWALSFKPSKAHVLTSTDFTQKVLKDEGPWIVDFYTQWCGHCQRFAPAFEQIAERMEGRVKAGKVDCDAQRWVCQQAGVRGYPTVYYYDGLHRGTQQRFMGESIHEQDANRVIQILNTKLRQRPQLKKDEL